MPKTAPYGSWRSPVTADLITGKSVSLMAVAAHGEDVYWIESRPMQSGRYAIVRRGRNGKALECIPPEFSARSTVHEYGGGAFVVDNETIYFANYADQHLYRQGPDGKPERLTTADGCRYADLVLDPARDRLICVREDHRQPGLPVNALVGLSRAGGDDGEILTQGNDFYSSAQLSPDGKHLAYLTWNLPNMPWDGCMLMLSELDSNGRLGTPRLVAGGTTESVFQPEWSPDGVLHFVAEGSGWWNLYRWRGGKIEALLPMQAEFAEAQWVFGISTYDFASATTILCCYHQGGISHLAWLDTVAGKLTAIESPYTDISDVRCAGRYAVFLAGSPLHPSSVVRMDTGTGALETITQSFQAEVPEADITIPEQLAFPTTDGRRAHGFFYAPKNAGFRGPETDRPPLIVMSHGGPTSAAGTTLRYTIQYWTSRGFAVLDVNYGGSTGYGREYRQRLNGNWGIVDVDDCCNGALYLAQQGRVDRKRLAIRGGSAGGYTTLACLTFRNDVFSAGASHYGLSELVRFATDTHKFESGYLQTLIGPFPERRDLYLERSPINSIQNLACPLILFQGDQDKIVPPSQSQMMFEAARAKGLPVAYLLFEGEQHGFRKAESIKRSLEAELYFYSKVFGFELADPVEPVSIENLS